MMKSKGYSKGGTKMMKARGGKMAKGYAKGGAKMMKASEGKLSVAKNQNPFTKAKQAKRQTKKRTFTKFLEPGKINRTGPTSITKTKSRGQQGTQSGKTMISRKKLPVGTKQAPGKAILRARNRDQISSDKIISKIAKLLEKNK